ncbi:MAG: DUF542 domain-containing protein, partial [Bradymonadaceae bacterium]
METTIDPDKSLAELVRENPARARLFEARGLDFCCGGSQSLSDACTSIDRDVEEICDDIAALDDRDAPDEAVDFDSLTELVDYIVDHHHDYLRDELGPLGELVEKVERVHGDNHPELHEVADIFDELARELPVHLSEEEQILFPVVRQLDDGEAAETETQTARQLLDGLEDDHEATAAHLEPYEFGRITVL